MARANAARLGLAVEVERPSGLPPGDYDLVLANLPYVRDDEWAGLAPEIRALRAARGARSRAPTGSTRSARWSAEAPPGTRLGARARARARPRRCAALLRGARRARDLAGRERVTAGPAP